MTRLYSHTFVFHISRIKLAHSKRFWVHLCQVGKNWQVMKAICGYTGKFLFLSNIHLNSLHRSRYYLTNTLLKPRFDQQPFIFDFERISRVFCSCLEFNYLRRWDFDLMRHFGSNWQPEPMGSNSWTISWYVSIKYYLICYFQSHQVRSSIFLCQKFDTAHA